MVLFSMFPVGCSKPDPTHTVQTYLQMLSGEHAIDETVLNDITTENYRASEHGNLQSLAQTQREWAFDRAQELRSDQAVKEFLNRMTWKTTYDRTGQGEGASRVVAHVVLAEKIPATATKRWQSKISPNLSWGHPSSRPGASVCL